MGGYALPQGDPGQEQFVNQAQLPADNSPIVPQSVSVDGGPQPQQPEPQMQPDGAQAPQIPQQPDASADAPQPFWKRILLGAFAGLAGSAGAHNWGQALAQGAGGEIRQQQQAFENNQQQQQNQSLIKFRDAQSAMYAAQAANEAKRIQILQGEAADNHDTSQLQHAQMITNLTGIPFKQLTGSDGVNQYAAQAATQGGVSLAAKPIVGTNFTLVPDTSSDNPINKQYEFASNFADALGGPKVPRQLFIQNSSAYLKPGMDYIQGLEPGGRQYDPSKGEVESAIKTTQAQQQAYDQRAKSQGQQPNDDLFKARLIALQNSQNAYLAEQQRKSNQSVSDAGRKDALAAQYQVTNVDDGNGGTVVVPRASVLPGGANAGAHGPSHGEMAMGTMPDGSQVAGTPQQLAQWGAQGGTKIPAQQQGQVITARQLVAPNGLIPQAQKSLQALDQQGLLGPIASRWGEFMTGKLGDDPQFAPYRTQMKLLQTALMQAHVGARGGDTMLQHFANIMDSGKMSADTMRATLGAVNNYMTEKAALPPGGINYRPGQGQPQPPSPQTHVFDSKAWAAANPGQDVNAAIAYAKQQGFTVK